MATFTCQDCGKSFTLPKPVLDRYPGWTPRQCMDCRDAARGTTTTRSGGATKRAKRSRTKDIILTTEEVLAEFTDGPDTGVFTDGGAVPNPGPGGWGAVYVRDGEIVAEASGHDPDTTNNRMELVAALEATKLVPEGESATIYADSRLVVQTINEWAAGWEKRGWKRKTGPVENLDLVQPLHRAFRSRPELKLEWIAAHSGYLWNEYADALASRWRAEV
jgi:ribonuclease HI